VVPHSRQLIVELAIGTLRHHLLPMVRVDAPVPAKIGASTRLPLNVEISANMPLGSVTLPTSLDFAGIF
jgi:hypothetical protein